MVVVGGRGVEAGKGEAGSHPIVSPEKERGGHEQNTVPGSYISWDSRTINRFGGDEGEGVPDPLLVSLPPSLNILLPPSLSSLPPLPEAS